MVSTTLGANDRLVTDAQFADAAGLLALSDCHASLGLEVLAGADRISVAAYEAMSARPDLLRSPALQAATSLLLGLTWRRRRSEADSDDGVTESLAADVLAAAETVGAPAQLEGPSVPLMDLDGAELVLLLCSVAQSPGEALLRRLFDDTVVADLRAEGYPSQVVFQRPTRANVDTLQAAANLLSSGAPELTGSLLAHVNTVAVIGPTSARAEIADRLYSVSNSALPSVVFLAKGALGSRLAAAEALLHEAVHHRLYALTWTRSIYVPGYTEATSPTVVPPWYVKESGGGKPWPADRVLAALHVYAHLAVLWSQLLDRPALLDAAEVPLVRQRLRRAVTKAQVLVGFAEGPMRSSYGRDGQRLVELLLHSLLTTTETGYR